MFFEDYSNGRLESLLSGNRFTVIYRLSGDEASAKNLALDICAEQTVEFPVPLLPPGTIPEKIVGQMERFEQESENRWLATIRFAEELAAGELTQFLNVLFGNISMKVGIQIVAVKPSPGILKCFSGPRFGIAGLREIIGIPVRPPLFTALKPMGLSAQNLATLAGQFAEGGIDIIKDDHGLSDQVFSPFEERVARCSEAVREVNARINRKAIYVPNVTAPTEQVLDRAARAKELGAGALMVSPGLTGLDTMRRLSQDINLPVLAHPAFLGGMAVTLPGAVPQGICCGALYGTLMRIAGADATIFPNYGGRFPLSREDCMGIVTASREELGVMRPIFPCPAGGMELKNIRDMIRSYGNDMLILVGSGLFRCGDNIPDNCRRFLDEVNQGT
jgi:ribulose-bisphosphate carboxylase large chain